MNQLQIVSLLQTFFKHYYCLRFRHQVSSQGLSEKYVVTTECSASEDLGTILLSRKNFKEEGGDLYGLFSNFARVGGFATEFVVLHSQLTEFWDVFEEWTLSM